MLAEPTARRKTLEIINELKTIQRMLNGMMITKPDGLDITLGHAAPVRLHQAGFLQKQFRNSTATSLD